MAFSSAARLPYAVLAGLAILASAPSAQAFCRSTTCPSSNTSCPVNYDQCKPLRWERTCIGISVQQNASREVDVQRTHDIVTAAFSAWMRADCGGGPPGIVVQDLGDVICGDVEYNAKAGNTNVVVFRDDAWPHPESSEQIALTTTTFSTDTGEIFNADIEINTADFDFPDLSTTPGDTNPTALGVADLQAVLTHETGHFLGLSHSDPTEGQVSADTLPTMHSSYSPINVAEAQEFRTLTADDASGVCAIYPIASIDAQTCNPIPRHGFAPECARDQVAGCGLAPGRADGGPSGVSALVVAALAAIRLRRPRSA